MSKKIKMIFPNKERPNLISLFHAYLVRKANEPKPRRRGLGSEGYIWDTDEYEDMAEYWDKMFPGWDDDIPDDDADVVFPPRNGNVIVLNPKKKGKRKGKRDAYKDFWDFQEAREENWSKGKHKHKKGKKGARVIDIYTPYDGDEEDLDFDDIDFDFTTEDYDDGQKEIWFYPDYHEKDDRLEFNSLKEFNDYCESMGYYVSKEVVQDISWRYESHCCLCPESEKVGLLEIMTEHSYGDMFYEACEEHELSDM